ncbi:MAG: lysylphosphatidylglycerol synthase domain-containing protein [Acidimicrobiia bacterium]|nr:lysylphosphatidylglycerol synthase domain-containing protein [Acidimicrobiia bacterium]
MIAPAPPETIRRVFVTDAPHHRDHIRSPVDVLRLIVAVALVFTGVFVANVFDSSFLGLSEDGASALAGLPAWVRQVPATVLAVAVLSTIIGALLWALATTRFRRFLMLLIGVVLASSLSVAVGDAIYALVDGPVRAAFDNPPDRWRFPITGDRIRPGDPVLAAAVAVLGISTSWLRRSLTQRLALVVVGYVVMATIVAGVPALGLLSDLGLGLAVASALLLAFGRHDLAPNREEIHEALKSIGVDLSELDHLEVDARGSAPWIGTSVQGDRIFVKALGRDERSADLMFRAYRWFRLRKTGDHRPFVSLRRAVEHEALVSLQAGALGIRTPRILGVTDAGIDGMVLAYEAIDGRSADQLEGINDAALESIWTMVSFLHSKRIAHRDLRLANVFLDENNEPWIIDFGFSELAASNQQLGTDVAELLASTAAVVGVDQAVRAAHVTSGVDELSRALPWLQPLALTTATRESIGKDGVQEIRTTLIERCQIPPEEPAKLQRIDGRTLFIVATVVLSSWFLVPQLADIDTIWTQVRTASIEWALVAFVFSAFTYVAATASLIGAIPYRLRFVPALLAQAASSFANRVTPARVGGVATNIRYFQKKGIPTAVGVTAVGLNAIAGLFMHVVLTLTFLILSGGSRESGGLPVPSPTAVAVGLAAAVTIIVASMAVPFTRSLVVENVLPQLMMGWQSMQQIGRSPGRLALLFGGSATITLAYLAAMAASLEAFGSTASLPLLGLLYLTGSAVANAAPTPGGLGAAEAALVAAFSLVEKAAIVIPAVFLFRFVTFWLPILPGWFALTYLRKSDQI